jgi:hypothetical protein
MHFVKRQGKFVPAVFEATKRIRSQNTGRLHTEPVSQINVTLQALDRFAVKDREELCFNSCPHQVCDGFAGARMTALRACKVVVHLGMRAKNINEHDADADLLESGGDIARYKCAVGSNFSEETARCGSQEGQEVRPMKRLASFNVEIDYAELGNFIKKATPLLAI